MKAKSSRAVSTEIGRIRIFLPGLYPVNAVVVRIKFVVAEFMAYQFGKQNKNCEPDNKIGVVDQGENLVVANVPENIDEKMSDHVFEAF
jgi:hypothetical protein